MIILHVSFCEVKEKIEILDRGTKTEKGTLQFTQHLASKMLLKSDFEVFI